MRVPVALKVINAAHLHSETARQRFVREARSAARLRHRNVASVFHLGQEGDNYFYAMEFIDGETVDARVKKFGPLKPALALKIAAQVARALNAAQTHELVHRDIKPANLMLVHEDDELIVKVIDFGLAKVALGGAGEDAATLTMSGFLGTPHFASPEQLEEREIDLRSDIYSLGVTLWFVLTGKTPFSGSVMQVMSQHITRQPPFEQLEGVPAPVVELLRGMLDKNPAQRPQTAIELRREIERCLEKIGDSPEAARTEPAAGDTTAASEAAETQFETGAAIGTRFIVSENVGSTEAGRVFRARDNLENRDVRLLALDRELLRDSEAIAQIEQDAVKLTALAHPNVLGVFGIENDGREAYLTLEWIDGFSLRDLLRARSELSLAEVLQLLPQAAAGIDAALTAQTALLGVTLPQLFVHFPAVPIASENLLRRTVETWPEFAVKFNALVISRDRFSLTWAGGQTIVGPRNPISDGDPDGPAQIVRELGAVVYEMLGGAPGAIGRARYTPLASVGEAGNEILRRAIVSPESFESAADFARVFAAPPEAAPLPVLRTPLETAAPDPHQTEVPILIPRAPVEVIAEIPPAEPAPLELPIAEPDLVPQPEPESPAAIPEPAPAPESATPFAPEIEHAAPRSRSLALPFGGIAALLVLAGVVQYSRTHTGIFDGKTIAISKPTPAVATPAPTPRPTPPPPPPPARTELAKAARNAADALEARQSIREGLKAWLAITRDYPEFKIGIVGLDGLIGRFRQRPGGLPRAEFEAMRDDITQAAKLNVLAAMLLLGEQLMTSEPATALEWFAAAAEKGDPIAMTKAALLLSNGVGPASDPEKVVHYLTGAAEMSEPNAMFALGQLHLSGDFGVKQDPVQGVALLRSAADKGSGRAKNALGICYRKGIGVGRDEKEAFRYFTQAVADGSVEAIGNLGVLYMYGEGTAKNLPKAVEQFKQASIKGDVESMFYYASCLEKGWGTLASKDEAEKWYLEAARAGHAGAADWCKKKGVGFEPAKPPAPE